MSPTVHDLADLLAPTLDRERYHREGDPAGVWIASDRPVRRLGLRLDAGHAPFDWAQGLDAVLIHRPFGLWPARLPGGLGVVAVHRALDDHASVGHTPPLAAALSLTPDDEPLMRGGKTVGLVGRLDPVPLADAVGRVERELGGVEDGLGDGPETVEAVALVGAMTDELVRAAAGRGAGLYVTGQLRQPARAAVMETGLRVLAVGQDRAEAWGLRWLASLVQERWPEVEVVESGLPAGGAGREGA